MGLWRNWQTRWSQEPVPFRGVGSSPSYPTTFIRLQIMKELSEIIQELVDSSNSMNQIDSKTAIQYVVEAYEAGMDKAKELIKDSGEL